MQLCIPLGMCCVLWPDAPTLHLLMHLSRGQTCGMSAVTPNIRVITPLWDRGGCECEFLLGSSKCQALVEALPSFSKVMQLLSDSKDWTWVQWWEINNRAVDHWPGGHPAIMRGTDTAMRQNEFEATQLDLFALCSTTGNVQPVWDFLVFELINLLTAGFSDLLGDLNKVTCPGIVIHCVSGHTAPLLCSFP